MCPTRRSCRTLLVLATCIFSVFSAAHGEGGPANDITVNIIPSLPSFAKGDTVLVAVEIQIPEKYHLYSNPMGPGIGKPLMVTMEGPDDVRWISARTRIPEKFSPDFGEWVWAYTKSAQILVKGILESEKSGALEGQITIDGLICQSACIPVYKKVHFSIQAGGLYGRANPFAGEPGIQKVLAVSQPFPLQTPVSASASQKANALLQLNLTGSVPSGPALPHWDYSPVEPRSHFNILLAVILGFLAGIILNVMPCVLPVLGIKILSFSNTRQGSRKSAVVKSLIFSSGMMSVFLLLASLASFAHFSWGQHFQNPWVLAGIITVIVVFGFGMFDLFQINVPSSISGLERKAGKMGMMGDFFNGVFATVLATPCSGPFLGATLAWTLMQSTAVIFLVFISIGAGMASPFILFSSSRRLSKLIPRPGKWMKDFKNLMGFALIGMAIYLMKGLPESMIVGTIGGCFTMVFAAACYQRIAPWDASIYRKAVATLIALVIATGGLVVSFRVVYLMAKDDARGSMSELVWKPFSTDSLSQGACKRASCSPRFYRELVY